MLTISQIRAGLAIVYQGEPYIVVGASHSKTGRAGAVVRSKLKSLKSGSVLEVTFQGNDKIQPANLAYKKCQFLYQDDLAAYFMDETFEQFSLEHDIAADSLLYLKEGQSVDIAWWNNKAVGLKLPPKVDLLVTEAAPAVRGDTANSPTKIVKLETGLAMAVPMFVKQGDRVRVNTETGEYVERA